MLQDSGQWRAFARLLDHLEEFKGLDNEKDFLSFLGERDVKEENLEEEWRQHCIVVEELGRRLEVQASLRERDKFIVHVGEVTFPLGSSEESSPLFQVRVVTALLASLGWRLGQAQEQGWHAEEKVRVFMIQTNVPNFSESRHNNCWWLIVNKGVKSHPILSPGHKTAGAAGGGAGTADDDTEEDEAGGKTLLHPPRNCNRRGPAGSDEGQGEPCGAAEGGWEEEGAGWEAA